MAFELSRLHELIAGRHDPLVVGPLPLVAVDYLKAKVPLVYLSRYSIQHILEEHPDVSLFDLLRAPIVLRDGLLIGDRNCVVASYCVSEENIRYKAVVKCAGGGCDLWLTTFHRTAPRQTKSLLKRGKVLRLHL